MVDIISKRSGPRREDVAARRVIDQNRPIIEGLANQLSGGRYAQMRQQRQQPREPQLDGFILHDLAGSTVPETEHQPYVRISLNGRVVVVDGDTSKQLHFLGEIREQQGTPVFVLATRENRFHPPLDDELSEKLSGLDGKPIDMDYSEEDLAAEINHRLGLH